MHVVCPHTLDEALATLAQGRHRVLAGGTDLMVSVNHGSVLTDDVVALDRVTELRGVSLYPDYVRLGGAATWTLLAGDPVRTLVPALAQAARTVGSPQIRNAGTIGGNIATASPAGDSLGVLVALEATIDLAAHDRQRTVALQDFCVGPKTTILEPDELIVAVNVPIISGWQGYTKVGVRNAMVIATVGVALVVDETQRRVGIGLTSVGPTPLRCPEAEDLARSALWSPQGEAITPNSDEIAAVAARAAAESRPIDDHRSSAEYRRHSVGVLVARQLRRAIASRHGGHE